MISRQKCSYNIHSTFSSLGSMQGDNYNVSPEALDILEEINTKLASEDQTLRTFRRAIGFSQSVKIDLLPLLNNAKNSKIIDAAIRILVNLTVPVECLFSVDIMYRTEIGRHTIFELNQLLVTSKEAFTDPKNTKTILDYMKNILETDNELSFSQCDSITNCLLLLRNILHIPEDNIVTQQGHHTNNLIIWNLFTQSIDKLLLHLISCPQRSFWGVAMVQLIALMYKDQHVSTLQKLLNLWFETSISESSEDNESNTSPPKQGSGDSSPMLTSDPTSDSSDNGGSKQDSSDDGRTLSSCKETNEQIVQQQITRKSHSVMRVPPKSPHYFPPPPEPKPKTANKHIAHSPNGCLKKDNQTKTNSAVDKKQVKTPSSSSGSLCSDSTASNAAPIQAQKNGGKKRECPSSKSDISDCGYGTQVENQESISTSSNEDEFSNQKPVHQKPPTNQKQRHNATNKVRSQISIQDKKEWRRKKLVKRSKSNLIHMKGLIHHTPTDEDISHILKEFTVDFLLKGYGCLVKELHEQLLSDLTVQIDTSHFFWLVTYFLKFSAQLELDLEHINAVLNFDVISYLTYEGVTLCEQLDLCSQQDGFDLRHYIRRLHLVVTAIREFLQALETYKKVTHLSDEDRNNLRSLQLQIGCTEDLRCLFVLLIKKYNPTIQSKQYLQDLIVTNHILLLVLDGVATLPENNGNIRMMEHISQFATVEVMHQYGLLLADFRENGVFVNDCIFTMMHHVVGDLGKVTTLFQPGILKTYSQICETEYELCDDWSDLVECIINNFINTPQQLPVLIPSRSLTLLTKEYNLEHRTSRWTQEEQDSLYWYYVQSKKSKEVIGKIVKLFKDNTNVEKSRLSIIQQLLQQDIITLVEYDDLMKYEDEVYHRDINTPTPSTSTAESGIEIKDKNESPSVPKDDIQILKEKISSFDNGKFIVWIQKLLLECCYVKLCLKAGKINSKAFLNTGEVRIMEPIAYHCIIRNQSIPLVTWNIEQSAIMLEQPCLLLLHKLGFQLPANDGRLFVRIPEFWTAEILFNVAEKLGPIDKSIIKFDLSLFSGIHSEIEEKTHVEEVCCEPFALGGVQHSNSIIRFTPEPTSTPSVPNWLQVVMRSKSQQTDRTSTQTTNSSISSGFATPSANKLCKPSTSNSRSYTVDEDSVLKSAENVDDENKEKKVYSLEDEYGALVASCKNEMRNCSKKSSSSTSFGFDVPSTHKNHDVTFKETPSYNIDEDYTMISAASNDEDQTTKFQNSQTMTYEDLIVSCKTELSSRLNPERPKNPSVPNWLQAALKNKNQQSDRIEKNIMSSSSSLGFAMQPALKLSKPLTLNKFRSYTPEDNSTMKSGDNFNDEFQTKSLNTLEVKNSALIHSPCEDFGCYETASVASNLTRMYVSDEGI